jgi:predicted DNA-binding transcriptional regulator AlpA
MTPIDQPRPALESTQPSGVELELGPVPLFVHLVRAVKSGERSQIDELREQLNGLGWTVEHLCDSSERAAYKPTSLTATANRAGPIDPRSAKRATKPTRSEPEIPFDQRLTWDLKAIASLTGLSRRHLERLRQDGRMPAPDAMCGRRILWFPKTIRTWLQRGGSLT